MGETITNLEEELNEVRKEHEKYQKNRMRGCGEKARKQGIRYTIGEKMKVGIMEEFIEKKKRTADIVRKMEMIGCNKEIVKKEEKKEEKKKMNKNALLIEQVIQTTDIEEIKDKEEPGKESIEISDEFLQEILGEKEEREEHKIYENIDMNEELEEIKMDEEEVKENKPNKEIEEVKEIGMNEENKVKEEEIKISLMEINEEEKEMINLVNEEEIIFEGKEQKEQEIISIEDEIGSVDEIIERMEEEEKEREKEIKELEGGDEQKEVEMLEQDEMFKYLSKKGKEELEHIKEYLQKRIELIEKDIEKDIEEGKDQEKDEKVEKKNKENEEMRKIELIIKKGKYYHQEENNNNEEEEDIKEEINNNKEGEVEEIRYKEISEGGKYYVWKLGEFLKKNPGVQKYKEKKDKRVNGIKKFASIDSDWEKQEFSWKENIKKCNNAVFGNDSFRPSQEAIINCVMSRNNALVLMPTGGGKSLCYQLPSYFIKGITVVVSPLVSLIQDQVSNLVETGMEAIAFYSGSSSEEAKQFYKESYQKEGKCTIKFVFVTPERITQSKSFKEALNRYYENNNFGMVVIDEAHCISQWGHDFRDSYQKLSVFSQEYPGIPILMLTATATERVKNDILLSLGINEAVVFSQSFNRKNLTYCVRPKTKGVIDEIEEMIKRKYKGQSGIIYCLSQKNTMDVAQELNKRGIKSKYYHAGMDTKERTKVQKEWCDGEFNVICATIAFGMGIDKPDVRFVIHHSLPKSLEGYYQESGRAGRDGEPADCILYYNYRDKYTYERFFEKDKENNGDLSHIQTARNNLNEVISYCENTVDCRRTLVLQYFGEIFNSKLCNKTCDNCYNPSPTEIIDMTELGKIAVEIVKAHQRITANMVIGIMRGTSTMGKKFGETSKGFKSAKGKTEQVMERFMKVLYLERVLSEMLIANSHGNISVYLKEGPKCKELMEGRIKIKVKCKKGANQIVEINNGIKMSEYQNSLMDKLNELRDQIFEEVRKQPGKEQLLKHNLFGTRVLKKIAAIMPRNKQEFEQIAMKRLLKEKYAERFISVVNNFISQHSSNSINTSSFNPIKRTNPIKIDLNRKSGIRDNSDESIFDGIDLDEFADDDNNVTSYNNLEMNNHTIPSKKTSKKSIKKSIKKASKKSIKKASKKSINSSSNGIQPML
ncbi:ATP-dependent helicase SGS1, putative [Entamoeba dispar SAW760]|uniref:DNA 3'-5' helicase n=1 Tax=Entamoeba dispar (strain ATCC PRA-260 / SAW760) TaxID=370354 RepID=B0EI54_ENTDS|nr:ATP-dependent helicase SGS1, putative [Entamoeba dispar SAW760]EDR25795.1 ATP-dependent helicase SGS1, putative [Entamoeba dispar SAW760]|eukprot:EDR25795.1 ATP-dependent helicase SGS1, putative [Entamoeba dispar SAW760]